jgi:hypothetical protein
MKLILFDKVQKGFPVRACVRSDAFALIKLMLEVTWASIC